MRYLLLAASLIAAPAAAQATPRRRLRAPPARDVETLVGFGTRHTLSSQDDPVAAIGEARRWGEAQFRAASGLRLMPRE